MTPEQAYRKAIHAGKLPEIEEDIIMTCSVYCYFYSQDIIDGKLPDKMHNMMILYAIKDPDDFWAKEYFKSIEDPNYSWVKEYSRITYSRLTFMPEI